MRGGRGHPTLADVTRRLAIWSSGRPRLTLAGWAVALAASIALTAAFLGDALSGDETITSNTESRRADRLAAQRLVAEARSATPDASEVVIVRSATARVTEPRFARRVRSLAGELERAGAVRIASFYSTGERRLISRDGHAAGLLVALGRNAEDAIDGIVAAVRRADGEGGFAVAITGEETLDADFSTLAGDDLRNGELGFGLPAALIVLLLVFGSVVAGLVPLLLAVFSITVALALTALVGQAFALSVFATNMLTGMGLALGIDYSLFIVSRFREERTGGASVADAIAAAGATASRAVLFSGIAFTLAMLGLLMVPSTIMRSLAVGAIAAALASVAAALTLLPALLALLGDRVDALRIPIVRRPGSRVWARLVETVTRHPLAGLVLSTVVLLALALPVLGLRSGQAGVETLPDRLAAKQGYLALNAAFPGETTEPVEVVVGGEAGSRAVSEGIDRLTSQLAGSERFGRPVTETNRAGDLTRLTIPVAGDPMGDQAVDAVRELRRDVIPAAFPGRGSEVLVGGDTAESIDEADTMSHWLPIVFAFVLGLSFALLTVAFRSLVVAAKAVAVNLLSVGAAYGVLVLVFQRGVGNELFGFPQVDTIESWVPLFLFAVLFGLSMDYHVFLLSRIRESYRETGDNTAAIIHGVASTGRIITGAALIIVAVFSGFARGELVMFQQMGFGVAVALLLDATIVRLVLVPAAMQLLGERNWYLPRRLRWLPDIHA
jgi:putative drug exporter of the RND superfamily